MGRRSKPGAGRVDGTADRNSRSIPPRYECRVWCRRRTEQDRAACLGEGSGGNSRLWYQILALEVETRPIVLAMLLDDSGSMQNDLVQAQTAAKRFVTRIRPEDKAMVVALWMSCMRITLFRNEC